MQVGIDLASQGDVTRMCQQFAQYHVVSEFGNFGDGIVISGYPVFSDVMVLPPGGLV
jgi:hypothetical protein